MRSHVALYFRDRPPARRVAPHGSDDSAIGAKDVSWDFTARPFAGFVALNAYSSWYRTYKTAKIHIYELCVDAEKLHEAAIDFSKDPPPYFEDYKWNTVCPCYPWRCCSCGSYGRRPTNCVGATLTVLAMAKGAEADPESVKKTLSLSRTAEWLMPSDVVRQLQEAGMLLKEKEVVSPRSNQPLLIMR